MITLAMDAFYRQQHHDTRAWGERALDVATELGDRPLTAAALAAVGLACAFTEAIADAELHCSRAAELIDAMPDPELAIRLDAIAYLTGAEVYLDRFEEATAHGRRGVSLARATGQGELLPMLTQALGVAFFARGLLGEAAELLDATTEAARLSGNRQLLAWNLLNRAFVAANQGEVETALAAAEESVDGDARPGRKPHLDVRRSHPRDRPHGERQPGAGRRALRRGRRRRGAPARAGGLAGEVPRAADALSDRARAHRRGRAVGRLRGRRRGRRPASARASPGPSGLPRAVAFARGDAATAAERALASAVAAEEVRRRARCRGLAAAGGPRARAGRGARPCRRPNSSAAAALDACGAVRYRQEAEHELRKLGHGVHRRTRPGKADGTGVDTLTERELELARLVVDRRTNPEIAAALFLSQKTVETHLRNMFRKLGVSSRVELARAVEQAERAQQG